MNSIYKENTEYGEISVSEMAVHKLVEKSLLKYKGKVFLTNSKGKRMPKVYKNVIGDQVTDVQVTSEGDRVTICVYLIMKFGLSIKETTDHIMEDIRKNYESAIGKNPWKIRIVITGVISKKLAKRNVEVEKTYEN